MAGNIKFWEIRNKEEYWLPGQCQWMWRGSWWEKFKHIGMSTVDIRMSKQVECLSTLDIRMSKQAGQASVQRGHWVVQPDLFPQFYPRRSLYFWKIFHSWSLLRNSAAAPILPRHQSQPEPVQLLSSTSTSETEFAKILYVYQLILYK